MANERRKLDELECEILSELYVKRYKDKEKIAELLKEFHNIVYGWNCTGSTEHGDKRQFLDFLKECRKDFKKEFETECEKKKSWI